MDGGRPARLNTIGRDELTALDTGEGATRGFFQKMEKGKRLIAETGMGNDVHIRVEVFEGMVAADNVGGAHQQDAGIPVRVTPTDDGTNAIVVLNTAAFIQESEA